jgi:5'-3' exoribonuclease 2
MKKTCSSLLALAVSTTLVSCGGPNSQTGAVIGALGGAAAGGIIGHQSGRGLEGAAIGGALGAVGGAVVGDAQDQRNYYRDRDGRYYTRDPYYGAPPPPPRGGYYRGY